MKTERKRKIREAFIALYVLIELGLLLAIKWIERSQYGDLAVSLMFLSIVVNALAASCCYCVLGVKRAREHEHLILVALMLTLTADLFLTFLGGKFMIPGVICFCVTETIYAFYLKSTRISVIFRVVLFAVLFVGAVLMKNVSVLNVFAILNISILFMNVVDAWILNKDRPQRLFRFGILLFFCCDMSVGLSTLLEGAAARFFSFMIWVFYIPSQMFLTLCYVIFLSSKTSQADDRNDLTDC